MARGEAGYQSKLIRRIEKLLPGCFIMKGNPSDTQGIPDLLILYRNRWAMLEVKFAFNSNEQPNQRYYVEHFNEMSFAAFINPSNEELVLNDLQSALGVVR